MSISNISFLLFSSLKFASTKITLFPVWANVTAKLFITHVFPSSCLQLVTKIAFLFVEYNIFVLIVFILSTICDFGLFFTINSFFSLSTGNVPMAFNFTFFSISSSLFIVSSNMNIATTDTIAKNRPANANIIISFIWFTLQGVDSTSASSTILMFCKLYISFICCVKTFANSFAIFLANSGFAFVTLIFKNCVLSICFASTFFCKLEADIFNSRFSIVFCTTFVLLAILL